ncbi:MAG: hypothetical protein M1816_003052 [Peltula sp. TS41687]|nr:MAG: hypothetical protein M1816_003052 [Peltula sp. TS41687]
MFRHTRPRLQVFLGTGPQYRHPPWEPVVPSAVKPASIPKPTPFVPDVPTFLKLIGRGASQYADKFPTWESFFSFDTNHLRTLGVEPPRMRRYLLRWKEKFRNGEFGIGGDLTEVVDGVAQLKIVEVPIKEGNTPSSQLKRSATTTLLSAGKTKIVVNVRPDEPEPSVPLERIRPIGGVKIQDGHRIIGSYVQHVKGTQGTMAMMAVKEGMWEQERGRKAPGYRWGSRKEVKQRKMRAKANA